MSVFPLPDYWDDDQDAHAEPVAPVSAFAASLRAAAFAFAVSRAIVFGVVLLCSIIDFVPTAGWERQEVSAVARLDFGVAASRLQQMWSSGDGHFYLQIAKDGYAPSTAEHSAMRNWVFFPAYPLLIRAISFVTGHVLASALLVANLAFYCALVSLHLLARGRGLSRSSADRAVLFVALNPMSYIFSSPMTESLFFFLLVGSFAALERGRSLSSGVLGTLFTACRPTGLLLLPAYLAAACKQFGVGRALLPFLLAMLGLSGFAYFLYLRTGDPLMFIHNQKYWDRNGTFFDLLPSFDLRAVSTGWNFIWLNAGAACAAFGAACISFVKRRYSDGLLLAVPVVALLSSGTVLGCFRVLMPLFPIWLMLGEHVRTERAFRAVVVVFSSGLALLSAAYALGVTSALV